MKRWNAVGPQIRKLRHAREWSQSKLALKLQLVGWNISPDDVARIETQSVGVRDYELLYLSHVFGITVNELLPDFEIGKHRHDAALRTCRCKETRK